MAAIFCPNCGVSNDSSVAFCGNCGNALQATGSATYYPPQGQQGSSRPTEVSPPPPPPIPTGNTTYPASGTPPPYRAGNSPSSATYPVAGTPPSYPVGNMPSSPTYPAGGSQLPPAPYPKGGPNAPPPQRRKGKKGLIVLIVALIVVILAGGVVAAIAKFAPHGSVSTSNSSTSAHGTTATSAATAASASPTQSTSTTATAGTTASTSPTQSTSTTATAATSANSYSATQPGPGCDTNGGTWTPQSIDKITCGTQLSINSANTRGYLYLQLPNNQVFAVNNRIGISGGLGNYNDSIGNCLGLAELGANAGYLVEYCNDGRWYIYSISSTGAVVQTLAKSVTSTRSSETISLTLKGASLTFTIDSEVHTVTITPLQPTKVAITYFAGGGYEVVTATNFSYTQAS